MSDKVLDAGEEELVNFFLQHLARVYKIDLSENEFYFTPISSGLSSAVKLVAHSSQIYPYFLKISSIESINREVSKHNLASSNLPPLYLAPTEAVIGADTKKYLTPETDGRSLVAYKYITGGTKGEPPTTLFHAFDNIDKYRMIELIDEIFQIVFQDLHSFDKNSRLESFFHFSHDLKIFENIENATILGMVKRYNNFIKKAKSFDLPHGMVHGDLHCENIIVNRRFTPIIIDFEMLRRDGCLLNDFAEFEIALLVAALDSNVDRFGPFARSCYSDLTLLNLYGIDKFSRCVRSIRTNLCYSIFKKFKGGNHSISIEDVSYIYYCLLLRYLCSYSWVSVKSMEERRSLVVVGVLSQIFDQIYFNLIENQ